FAYKHTIGLRRSFRRHLCPLPSVKHSPAGSMGTPAHLFEVKRNLCSLALITQASYPGEVKGTKVFAALPTCDKPMELCDPGRQVKWLKQWLATQESDDCGDLEQMRNPLCRSLLGSN